MRSKMRSPGTRGPLRDCLASAVLLAFALLASPHFAAPASAAAPDLLWQVPDGSVVPGEGLGEFDGPRGIAADPTTGKVYISDLVNSRIDEFTAWGEFVRAWGWNVAPDGAPGDTASDQFEVCTVECQKGAMGTGAGQLINLLGITVDAAGDVYVREDVSFGQVNARVQKFDTSAGPSGADVAFELMFGGEVNKGPNHPGNICTAQHIDEGDTCGNGVPGANNAYLTPIGGTDNIEYNPSTGTIFVGDRDRIQEFALDGAFEGAIDFKGALSPLAGKDVTGLAVDPASGALYIVMPGVANVYRLDPDAPTLVEEPLDVPVPRAVTTDIEGNVYVSWDQTFFDSVVGFDSAGDPIPGMESDHFAKTANQFIDITGLATNLCTDSEGPNLYVSNFNFGSVSTVTAYGPGPIGCENPPLADPRIEAQYATTVGTDSAILKAGINPVFWPDATYFMEYGPGPCPTNCVARLAPPGIALTTKSIRDTVTTEGIVLTGLEPDTVYHYRFAAQSGGSLGNPVFGVGGEVGVDGLEGTFKTFPLPPPDAAPDQCSNSSFRTGLGAKLPDCRAYEMVSPLDKNNADIRIPVLIYPRGLNQSSVSGDGLTYSSTSAFADPQSTPYSSQYLAHRDLRLGWSSESIVPPRARTIPGITIPGENEYKAFSADLCQAWLHTFTDPPFGDPAGIPNFRNLYRRDNCAGGSYEAMTIVAPPHVTDYAVEPQGASTDGSRSIFITNDNLPNDLSGPSAPNNANGRAQLYEHIVGEGLRFACVLPNGAATSLGCSAGTLNGGIGEDRHGNLTNAISSAGDRIFWSASVMGFGPGEIYVRIDGTETVEVSSAGETISGTSSSRFWHAADNGSAAIYTTGTQQNGNADLYRFGVDGETTTPIAGGVYGLMGASEDASRIYFASREVLGGENSEGDEAQAGQPNLYLWEEGGDITFIGTLSVVDAGSSLTVSGENPSPISTSPFQRAARVSPDGAHAVFMSTASLTGYDNIDVNSGMSASEVFVYSVGSGDLFCASCNPSGARPLGRDLQRTSSPPYWAAAKIPTAENALYASRVLSGNGQRLFFESFESLVPRDSNGAQDVYRWQAVGAAGCDDQNATFSPEAGGCVDLISSGQSPRASEFIDADPTGEDVFFTTLASLLPRDYGLIDIYNARVGGGFPEPESREPCEGEACQSPPAPPAARVPSSATFSGSGNVRSSSKSSQRCGKGKRKARKGGKTRCVKKKPSSRKKRSDRRKSRNSRGGQR